MKIKVRLTPTWWAQANAYSRGRSMGIALAGMESAEVRVTRTSLHVVIEPAPECSVATVIELRNRARDTIEALGPTATAAGAA